MKKIARIKSGLKPSEEREVRSLFENWEQNTQDAQFYLGRAVQFQDALAKHGVVPESPPAWLTQEQ